MKKLVLVSLTEALRNTFDDPDSSDWIHRGSIDGLVERVPINQLHDEKKHVIDLAEVIDSDQIGMGQFRHRACLDLEARGKGLDRRELRRQDFNCHVPTKRNLLCAVDCSHLTAADKLPKLESREKGCKCPGIRRSECASFTP